MGRSDKDICPCCGSRALTTLREVGVDSRHATRRCQVCEAIVRASDRCPKCGRPYYGVNIHETHAVYVHRREYLEGQWVDFGCQVPRVDMPGFTTAREVLRERCGV